MMTFNGKLVILILPVTLFFLLLRTTSSQSTILCPSLGTISIIPINTSTSSTVVRIPVVPVTENGTLLCTLVRSDRDGTNRVPVARSYRGNWEVSAGHYAKTDSGLSVDCLDDGGVCDVTLPQIEATQQYILETHRHFISPEAEAARFLEQATFGTTKVDLEALLSTENNFTHWVYDQMYNTPMSSHREFYRRHTNPKFEYPYQVGAVGPTPCERYSRWRRYALTSRDTIQGRRTGWNKFLSFHRPYGVEGVVWKVDGQFRTITKDHPKFTDGTLVELDKRYRIPNPDGNAFKQDCVGCLVPIGDTTRYIPQHYIVNPAVSIDGVEGRTNQLFPYRVVDLPPFKSPDFLSIENATSYHHLFAQWIHADENGLLNTTSLEETDQCVGHPNFRQPIPLNLRDAPPGTIPTVFGRSVNKDTGVVQVFAYDPHLALRENTVESPLEDGGGDLVMETDDLVAGTQVLCQNVQRNFLNEKSCKLSYSETACTPNTMPKRVIILNEENLASISKMTGRKLFAVTGLSLSDIDDETGMPHFSPPCRHGKRTSRWIRSQDGACGNTSGLGHGTLRIFRDIIDAVSNDGSDQYYNPIIVDVTRNILACDHQDMDKYILGNVRASGSCWTHVHPYERSVFDLTNLNPSEYNMISENLVSVSSWQHILLHPLLGKFGDHVILDGNETAPLDDEIVQKEHKSMDYNPSKKAVLVCGSPGEVASNPLLGDQGFDVVVPEPSGYRTASIWQLASQRHTVWTHFALHGKDQLRQRVAWALSQIIAVGIVTVGGSRVSLEMTEPFLEFYDQFVRNAFGSYRSLMLEFSFNVLMAKWLSFVDNKSLQWNIMNGNGPNFPDENFAREIMQLFSIGLYQLNPDGSQVLTDNGHPVEAYTMDDILSYSRAWTGFVRRPIRGGVVTANRELHETTSLDPMQIDTAGRDVFPKTDLLGDYIGSRVAPLCVDLPNKHFLRLGATYKLLGGNGSPTLQHDPIDWSSKPDLKRIELNPYSPLYSKLCNRSALGECTFPSTVELHENLVYDEVAQLGEEYAVDTLRTVMLKSSESSSPVFYEYVRQPCVELAFFENGKKVIKGHIRRNYVQQPSMCGNPLLEVATAMCSQAGWNEREKQGRIHCHYHGERMTYAAAEVICRENNLEQSHPWILESDTGPCGQGIEEKQFSSWSNADCLVNVKIALDNGNIAIVNDPQHDHAELKNVEPMVREDTINFFKAFWFNGHPTVEDCESIPSCYLHIDQESSCICKVAINEYEHYTNSDELVDISSVFSSLHIGAVNPDSFDTGMYDIIGDCGITGLSVFSTTDGGCSNFTSNTIFSMKINGVKFFLKNKRSVVQILDQERFSFRNPIHFINMVDPTARDILYETEAVIDSLFYHPNHPTFLAIRLIQRFGISNPSPDFILRVSEAYKEGTYSGGMFGSGQYGDLAAMVAAILLDTECRTPVLDLDQAHGHLREPIIKVLSFFRSMGLSYDSPLHIPTLLNTYDKLGQGSYETPSVFSFFLPEFSPTNTRSAELTAPEGMVLQSHRVLGLIDSFYSTIKTGVSNCYPYTFDGSNGDNRGGNQNYAKGICATNEGDTSLSPAKTTYWPSSTSSAHEILEELNILLTSGRLTDENKELIKVHLEREMKAGDVAKAIRLTQELILSTPEYHSTNTVRKKDDIRATFGYDKEPQSQYKAVVVLMMIGGLDSFNLLLPKGQCIGPDQYQMYKDLRGDQHAIPLSRLESIYAHGSNQTCSEYGVNSDFDILAELYDNEELIFLANTGVLSKPMMRDNWQEESSFQPFAHNIMQHEFFAGDPYNVELGTGVFGRMLDILKAQHGYQTAAFAVNGGEEMLTGDPYFGNSVQSLQTVAPQELNRMPTIDNIYEVAKQLNGIGNSGNSFYAEAWSSSFASALFDHDQMREVADIPEFTIPSNDFPISQIGSSLKAVAQNMRSRDHRKVNREVYVVPDHGYDLHFGGSLSDLLYPVNAALKQFIAELKSQGIWDDTLIVLGSDFGRSLTANSNGGTDHAWGGNYFMAGGNVKGGKILGDYPDLSPDNLHRIDTRARFVPTTPWDSVWNGIANWFGIRDEPSLNYAVPNRDSFNECDLFYDSQLFRDGSCTCSSGCPDGDILSVSKRNIPIPAKEYTPDYSAKGRAVASILDKGSTISSFGCRDPTHKETIRAIDQTTEKFFCERTSLHSTAGIIASPSTKMSTIAKGLRLYTHNNCPACDVVSYIIEGRINDESGWVMISEGDLPWTDNALPRNEWGDDVISTFEGGDVKLHFIEVRFPENNKAFLEYKVSFTSIRDPKSKFIQFGEMEVPGFILDDIEPYL